MLPHLAKEQAFLFLVLGAEPKASVMPGECSIIKLHPQPREELLCSIVYVMLWPKPSEPPGVPLYKATNSFQPSKASSERPCSRAGCSPSAQEAEAGGSLVQDQAGLHNKALSQNKKTNQKKEPPMLPWAFSQIYAVERSVPQPELSRP